MRTKFVFFGLLALFITKTTAVDCNLFKPSRTTIPLSTPSTCDGISTSSPFASTDRGNIIDKVNLYRAQLANGCAEQSGATFAPAGKNIAKLTYNCTLESMAQAWANQCKLAGSPVAERPGIGQTAYAITSRVEDVGNPVLTNFDYFWDKLKIYGSFTADNTKLVDNNMYTWAQMAWGKTTSVGCAYATCPHPILGFMHLVICNYYPSGVMDQDIYEVGSACVVDADCTEAGFAGCDADLGLCVSYGDAVPVSTTTPVASTMPITTAEPITTTTPVATTTENTPTASVSTQTSTVTSETTATPVSTETTETVPATSTTVSSTMTENTGTASVSTQTSTVPAETTSTTVLVKTTSTIPAETTESMSASSTTATPTATETTATTSISTQSSTEPTETISSSSTTVTSTTSIPSSTTTTTSTTTENTPTSSASTQTSTVTAETTSTVPDSSTTVTSTTSIPSSTTSEDNCSKYAVTDPPIAPAYFGVTSTCDGINTGSSFDPSARTTVLDRHNAYRSRLANGCAVMPNNEYAPPAKNMLKLTYNCSLEKIAQQWADSCVIEHSDDSHRPGAGETLYYRFAGPDYTRNGFIDASDWAFNELTEHGGINATSTVLEESMVMLIGHFTNMVWATTTSVGCGFARCPNDETTFKYYVVCNYWPGGNWINQNIYEIGQPCAIDSDCTVAGFGKCETSTGLCTTV
uniref:SCP domain-containing protein n=1 Tax=Panagrellus redivivus TaxID=6233 RepID=A0A7E4URJ1_PANRE